MAVVYSNKMEFECKACNRRIKQWKWKIHERGNKHKENVVSGNFDEDTVCVVIIDEKKVKQCRKCGCYKVLELYRGENETCNLCLDSRKRWAQKNPEKVKEMNRKYRGENPDEIREKKKAYNQIEIWCGICECNVRKCKWRRHEKTNKHRMRVDDGKTDGGNGVG